MNKLEEIKKFWLAPIFKEFEYNELRDHNNDIEWLISRVEELEEILEDRTSDVEHLHEQNQHLKKKLWEYKSALEGQPCT